jgi:uncharacterized protein (DUF952 family)
MTPPASRRLVERFAVGARVEVLLRTAGGDGWTVGSVIAHAHPGVWVAAAGGRWFVTNGTRIRAVATVYKIATREQWDAAQRAGAWAGSADDLRDGFVHLSSAAQVRRTAEKHFAGREGLVLLEVSVASLDALHPGALRWEPSRGGDLFPHLHATLPCEAVVRVRDLVPGPGGVPVLPPDDAAGAG